MVGSTIGHYRILSQLGSGGMGIVFEAEDLDLHRRVALKFLPDALANDPAALDRFLLEARSASALNHPNICTIHAVEREDGRHFIAMELLEGDTLDRRILHQPLSLDAMLDLCIQVADALDTAHHKGIIHRDIKPGNIFITTSGRAKVVDFGLAKITNASLAHTVGGGAPTAFATNPGSTVGTVAYMSPEQARGDELDPRSDLFSFGAVMYQMATGSVPFEGATSAVIFTGILEKPHTPPRERNPDLPPRFAEIIDRALEKERDLRFQTAAEIRAELKRLKRDTSSGKSQVAVAASGAKAKSAAGPSSSAILIAEAKRHKTGLILGAGVLVLLLSAAAFGIYAMLGTSGPAPAPHGQLVIKRLNSPAKSIHGASISPDGKYIAYGETTAGKQSIWLYQVATGSIVRLVPETEDKVGATVFSPDGDFVYYVRLNSTRFSRGALFSVPTLGGESRPVLEEIFSPVTFSPDGRQMAYVRGAEKNTVSQLVVTDRDGNSLRIIGTLKNDTSWFGTDGAAWSPDGRYLAVARWSVKNGLSSRVAIYDLNDGSERSLGDASWKFVFRVLWLNDGTGLIVSAQNSFAINRAQIWHISYPQGVTTRVTNDLNGYGTVSLGLSRDDKNLVTVQSTTSTNVWITEDSRSRALTSGSDPLGTLSVAAISTGAIFYLGDANSSSIFTVDSSGNSRRVSREGVDIFQFAPDPTGQHLVYVASTPEGVTLWRIRPDGSQPRQLTQGPSDDAATVTPDGKTVIFTRWADGKPDLWQVSIEGGSPSRLTSFGAQAPHISADGNSIVAMVFDANENRFRKALFAITGGEPQKVFDLPQTANLYSARFSPDGKGIIYADNKDGIGNLWLQPLAGGAPRKLTNFTEKEIFGFALGPKPGSYVLGRGDSRSDLVLIQNFR